MNMRRITALFVITAFVFGFVFGYALKPDGMSTADRSSDPVRVEKAITDVGDRATVAALRTRLAELERRLAASGASVVTTSVAAAERSSVGAFMRGPERMREEMERLRREEPERFAQFTNFIARSRQSRAAREQSRREFLASIGTGSMTKAQKETHDALQELLARREELDAALHAEGLSDDERHALHKQRRETDRQLRQLNRAERDTLLQQTTDMLGYKGDDAAEIIATVKDIFEATDLRAGFPGGEPPPGPPPSEAPMP